MLCLYLIGSFSSPHGNFILCQDFGIGGFATSKYSTSFGSWGHYNKAKWDTSSSYFPGKPKHVRMYFLTFRILLP